LKNIKLILTFFTLWLSVFFTDVLEDYIAYFFILSLGILHGANDLGVGEKTLKKYPILSKNWVMLLFYVLSIFVVAFLLMQFPSVTLALFVLFSAYHFGEQHWEPYLSNAGYVSKIFMMSYGMVVFFLLFNAHSILVIQIIADISGYWFSASVLRALLYVFIMITLLIYTIRYYSKFDGSFKVRQLFYLLVFFVVFNSTTLLWAFAIYFIFWHSLPSLLDQMNFLYGRRDFKGFVMFVKSSWLYWAMAVLSLGIYFLIIQHYYTLELSLFFAFLTALTIPHIFLMYFSKKVE
jgi:Brp/Blh family beta-carotene 15,15'-monooxygenase